MNMWMALDVAQRLDEIHGSFARQPVMRGGHQHQAVVAIRQHLQRTRMDIARHDADIGGAVRYALDDLSTQQFAQIDVDIGIVAQERP
jgi:hypothetical protein